MKLHPSVKLALSIAAGVGVLLGAYGAIVQIIDSRVDARLRTSQVKEEIIREVSRYVVFDGKGTVVQDPNKIFDEWIESISVEKKSEYGALEAWVRIKFKRLVVTEPLLHSYGSGARAIAERVSSLEWKFNVIATYVGPDPVLDSTSSRYLLQIFR
jgi:hypothetical protein